MRGRRGARLAGPGAFGPRPRGAGGGPVRAAELTKAKEYAKGRLLLQLESTSAVCEFAGQQELLTDKIITAEEVVARLDDVDATGVQRVAQRLLAGGLRAAVVGPFRGESRFAAALAE